MKFLLIEDDHEIVETINLLLEMRWAGANLISTISGKKGIELAQAESPDCVILDLGLPDIDGFQVLDQIRGFSDVPLIILTLQSSSISNFSFMCVCSSFSKLFLINEDLSFVPNIPCIQTFSSECDIVPPMKPLKRFLILFFSLFSKP